MSRSYTNYCTTDIKQTLQALLIPQPPADYHRAMVLLGMHLGNALAKSIGVDKPIYLVCTNEDADSIATGCLNSLTANYPTAKIPIACLWTRKSTIKNSEIATIFRTYVEPAAPLSVYIVIKSILASGCTVLAAIEEMLGRHQPKEVLVASPVMLKGVDEQLRAEFSERLTFTCFAIDEERNSAGEVIPGIGGMMAERLGSLAAKKTPTLVKMRSQPAKALPKLRIVGKRSPMLRRRQSG